MKQAIQLISFVFLFFVMCSTGKAQPDSTYSLLVAGHAYGAHAGTNIGLHPPLLKKLEENAYPSKTKIFFTGDIVNYSNTASWEQVARETGELDLDSYYVMGNHDNNTTGKAVFLQKHGGLYYWFSSGSELYIILNSTESDRSISPAQLEFLENILANTDSNWNRVFIFFHEIIWNSHEKYKQVRSNSRSRYDQMKNHSNFWNEVFPMLTALAEKEFYLIAGDAGGNPDAIAASYDKWENVTLISSGMGEVPDENYLKVDVLPDTVEFTLIPLNHNIEMHPVQWYNVPETPKTIDGPEIVNPPVLEMKYEVTPVFNATSYQWTLSNGITGASDSASIVVNFAENFQSGEISVSAVNDGFGISESVALNIVADSLSMAGLNGFYPELKLIPTGNGLHIEFHSEKTEKVQLHLVDLTGRILYSDEFDVQPGINLKYVNQTTGSGELVIMQLVLGSRKFTRKIIVQ